MEEIEALGKPFDPNFMNAVQQIPAPDGQESGTVIRFTRRATSWAIRSSAMPPLLWQSDFARPRKGFQI